MDLSTIPWPEVGLGSGWFVALYFVRLLFTGRVVTRREADVYIKQAETASAHAQAGLEALAKMVPVSQLQKAAIDAALVVRDAPKQEDGS